MKMRYFPVAAAVAASIAVATTTLPGADAHTAEVTASCEQGLQVHLRFYDRDTKVSIVVNGDEASAVRATFSGDYDYVYSLRVPPAVQRYVVTVDNAGTRWDAEFTGTVDCTVPATTTTTTTPAPTTTGHPATPPCLYPGKGIYDYDDARCVETKSAEIGEPAVEEAPVAVPTDTPIIAFTG